MISRRNAMVRRSGARRHTGNVLLFVLLALLVVMLGGLYMMREQFNETVVAGNELQREKNVHMSDVALPLIVRNIEAVVGENQRIEDAPAAPNWFVAPATEWPAPGAVGTDNEGYWSVCTESGDKRCARQCVGVSGPLACTDGEFQYIVKYVVVPTNIPTSSRTCGHSRYKADFYSIFVHVQEASSTSDKGPTSATIEAVYRRCVKT